MELFLQCRAGYITVLCHELFEHSETELFHLSSIDIEICKLPKILKKVHVTSTHLGAFQLWPCSGLIGLQQRRNLWVKFPLSRELSKHAP